MHHLVLDSSAFWLRTIVQDRAASTSRGASEVREALAPFDVTPH